MYLIMKEHDCKNDAYKTTNYQGEAVDGYSYILNTNWTPVLSENSLHAQAV